MNFTSFAIAHILAFVAVFSNSNGFHVFYHKLGRLNLIKDKSFISWKAEATDRNNLFDSKLSPDTTEEKSSELTKDFNNLLAVSADLAQGISSVNSGSRVSNESGVNAHSTRKKTKRRDTTSGKEAVVPNSKITVLGKLNTESTECKN